MTFRLIAAGAALALATAAVAQDTMPAQGTPPSTNSPVGATPDASMPGTTTSMPPASPGGVAGSTMNASPGTPSDVATADNTKKMKHKKKAKSPTV